MIDPAELKAADILAQLQARGVPAIGASVVVLIQYDPGLEADDPNVYAARMPLDEANADDFAKSITGVVAQLRGQVQ